MSLFKKNIFLVRHGETESNINHVVQGHIDSPLTELGVRQAMDVAQKAKDFGIDVLLSSDLGRAMDTAKIISSSINVPVEDFSPAYRERNFGDIEGKPVDELMKMYPDYVTHDGKFILEYDFPQAETVNEFYNRAVSGIFGLREKYPDQKVMLVTHKGILNMIYAYINEIPVQIIRTVYSPANCVVENY